MAKRKWSSEDSDAAKQQKKDGVAAAAVRSSYDRDFRDRLMSRDEKIACEALREGGDFESLPDKLHVRAFDRLEADDHVHLVLPPFSTPPNPNVLADAAEYWRCTWFPYSDRPDQRRRELESQAKGSDGD